jgi:hypothetical protein
LRKFSKSAGGLDDLEEDLAKARKLLGARQKQLQQQWFQSLTVRHVISLLDEIDKVAQVFHSAFRNGLVLHISSKFRIVSLDSLPSGKH